MREYYINDDRMVVHFRDVAAATFSGFHSRIEVSELADVAMERLTVDYWKGAPSKGWIYRRINEELAKIHTDDAEYTDIMLEENGYVCNSQCLEDVTFEVNRRLNEDERFVEAQTWHFKGDE